MISDVTRQRRAFWAHFAQALPELAARMERGNETSRWLPVGPFPLVAAHYVGAGGVGIFVRGPAWQPHRPRARNPVPQPRDHRAAPRTRAAARKPLPAAQPAAPGHGRPFQLAALRRLVRGNLAPLRGHAARGPGELAWFLLGAFRVSLVA